MRTAAHVAVASSVHNRIQRRQHQRFAEANQAAAAAAPAPAAAPAEDTTARRLDLLRELADLHSAGILTEAEFAEQKARILASV